MIKEQIPLKLLVVLALLSLPFVVSAQEVPPVDTAQRDLEISKTRADALKKPSLADPAVLVDAVKDDLRHWPRHARGEEAVRKILRNGKDSIPYLLTLFDDRDYRMKPALAYLLGKLVKEDADRATAKEKIKPLLYDPNLKASVWHLLQALYQIDPAETQSLSLEFLLSENNTFRSAAFGLLSAIDNRGWAPQLYKAMEKASGDSRWKIFQLLVKDPCEQLDQAALAMMGDPFPSLAEDVSAYLAFRKTPLVIDTLKNKLTYESERTFAFALTTMVSLENNYDLMLIEKDRAPDLEKFLQSRDPLFRVSAAAAMANLCSRSGSEKDINMIRNRIVPVFMDVFLKNQYFKDYQCMLHVAAASLRKLTGEAFGDDLTFWHNWWKTQGVGFTENQFLITVDPSDYPRLVLRCSGLEFNHGAPFNLAGESLIYDRKFRREPWTVFLSSDDMKTMVNYLFTQGFFNRRSMTAAPGEKTHSTAFIEMKVDTSNRIVVAEGAPDPVFDAMFARISLGFSQQLWQLLYPHNSDFGKWWETRYSWWKDQESNVEKTNRLIEDLIETIQSLPDAELIRCLDYIKSMGSLSECLDESESMVLLSRLGENHVKIDAAMEAMVDLVLTAEKLELLDPLLLYLYGSYGEAAIDLIGRSLTRLNQVEASLKSPRWFVRGAAAQACAQAGRYVVPKLIPLLADSRMEVRYAAIRTLAVLPTEQSINALREVMNGDDPKARSTLIHSLAPIDEDWVFEFYDLALKGTEPLLWPPALQGLSRHGSRVSTDIVLRFVQDRDLASEPAQVALEALYEMGGAPARDALYSLLAKCPNKETLYRILLSLAFLGDIRIFPQLQDCLLVNDLRPRAIQGMAFLLVKDFEGETWKYRDL
ncbi:MAG: HEAT repeat domain-containing protein, partial [Planctomycetota bacterium]